LELAVLLQQFSFESAIHLDAVEAVKMSLVGHLLYDEGGLMCL